MILRNLLKNFLKAAPEKSKLEYFQKYTNCPMETTLKKMEGYDNRYRLRIGDFRVIYELHADGVTLIVLVVEIGNRGDVYK